MDKNGGRLEADRCEKTAHSQEWLCLENPGADFLKRKKRLDAQALFPFEQPDPGLLRVR